MEDGEALMARNIARTCASTRAFIARRGINLEINNFKAGSSPAPEMLMKVACDALQRFAGQSTRDFRAGLKRAPTLQS